MAKSNAMKLEENTGLEILKEFEIFSPDTKDETNSSRTLEDDLKELAEEYNKMEVDLNMKKEKNIIERQKLVEQVLKNGVPKLIRPNVNIKERITAIYPYTNEKGNILYEMVRQREGQPYCCRRPTGNGEYEYSIKGIERVIYNLPRIKQAIKNKEIVFIVEGESKVETLTELGFAATTVAFNQYNKWYSSYNEFLKGAEGAIIIQDDDQFGLDFANNTYTVLRQMFSEEKIGIMPITEICPELNKQGADITDVRDFMRDDEKLKLILESIASQI